MCAGTAAPLLWRRAFQSTRDTPTGQGEPSHPSSVQSPFRSGARAIHTPHPPQPAEMPSCACENQILGSGSYPARRAREEGARSRAALLECVTQPPTSRAVPRQPICKRTRCACSPVGNESLLTQLVRGDGSGLVPGTGAPGPARRAEGPGAGPGAPSTPSAGQAERSCSAQQN